MLNNLINNKYPDRVAVITNNGIEITYRNLVDDINDFYQYIKKRSLVFILGRNDYPSLICYLSLLENNSVSIILSPDLSSDQILELIRKYNPNFIFSEDNELFHDYEIVDGCVYGDYLLYKSSDDPLKMHDELSFLMSTSGSTGEPKLVKLSKNNLVENAGSISEYLRIDSSDTAVLHLPINYSFAISIINSHLYSGATIFITDKSIMEKEFWEDFKKYNVTSFSGVPYHYDILLRLGIDKIDAPNLKTMTQAGGRLDPKKMERVFQSCEKKGIQFYTMYGQTEASPRISYLPTENTLKKLGSIGIAIPRGKLWIRSDTGEDITLTGNDGELIYEGKNVFLGYAQCADDLATGDQFGGVLSTGDIAYADKDGYFYLKGRLKRFLKIYGNRISLDQVERYLSNLGFESVVSGADDKLVVNLLVDDIEKDEKLSLEIRKKVAKYCGVNFVSVFVNLINEIPRLSNGKIDYQCIKK